MLNRGGRERGVKIIATPKTDVFCNQFIYPWGFRGWRNGTQKLRKYSNMYDIEVILK